jgi:glucose/mannose-6-phosphate isomerase
MLGEIDNLPDQYLLTIGLRHDLPDWTDFDKVIAGMGGSAIGADLLASYCAPLAPLPVSVHRDYGLPLFARGAETLVICSSHSGNTEETLEAFEAARKAECRIIVVSTAAKRQT